MPRSTRAMEQGNPNAAAARVRRGGRIGVPQNVSGTRPATVQMRTRWGTALAELPAVKSGLPRTCVGASDRRAQSYDLVPRLTVYAIRSRSRRARRLNRGVWLGIC